MYTRDASWDTHPAVLQARAAKSTALHSHDDDCQTNFPIHELACWRSATPVKPSLLLNASRVKSSKLNSRCTDWSVSSNCRLVLALLSAGVSPLACVVKPGTSSRPWKRMRVNSLGEPVRIERESPLRSQATSERERHNGTRITMSAGFVIEIRASSMGSLIALAHLTRSFHSR